jgi:hypothetical protein
MLVPVPLRMKNMTTPVKAATNKSAKNIAHPFQPLLPLLAALAAPPKMARHKGAISLAMKQLKFSNLYTLPFRYSSI